MRWRKAGEPGKGPGALGAAFVVLHLIKLGCFSLTNDNTAHILHGASQVHFGLKHWGASFRGKSACFLTAVHVRWGRILESFSGLRVDIIYWFFGTGSALFLNR